MEIERLLEEGTTVVCDRYAFSGLAFSLAKVRPGSLSWNPSNKKNADSLL
jgi:thymidylate kinase